eukprot:COSAG06_NODE_1004_length_11128_cov_5.572944_8_plen_64_part_00
MYQLYGSLLTKLHGMRWSTLAHAVADTSRLGNLTENLCFRKFRKWIAYIDETRQDKTKQEQTR